MLVRLINFCKEAIGESIWNEVSPDSDEIVGGHDVDIKQYPYQVSLVLLGTGVRCGGSILSPDFVLIAAHCFKFVIPSIYRIRAGSSFHDKSGKLYAILSLIKHPRFDSKTFDYDVGLIKTEKMNLNGVTTKAVQLAEAGSALKPGATVVVTGWGFTSFPGNFSSVLQAVSMSVVSSQTCRDIWSQQESSKKITERMFCAGSEKPGGSACNGDFGGPVVEESSLIQYGIMSFGYFNCDVTKVPQSCTNIPAVRDWIKEQTGI